MPRATDQQQWLARLHSMARALQLHDGLSREQAYHAVKMALAWRWLADEELPVEGEDWCIRWRKAQGLVGGFFHSFAAWPIDHRWEELFSPLGQESLPTPIDTLLSMVHQQALDDEEQRGRGGRRARGSFYTPSVMVTSLLSSSLGTWSQQWRERWSVAGGAARSQLLNELAHFVVLDPACGAGAFLLPAWEQITQLWQVAGSSRPAQDALTNISGWDRDGEAIALLRLSISVRLLQLGEDASSAVTAKLIVGDFLQCQPRDGDRVDLVVGNPPWVRAKYALTGDTQDRRRQLAQLRQHYPDLARGELNLYTLFISRALDWLKPGGCLAFIVPNSFLLDRNSSGLRRRLACEFAVEGLTTVGEQECRKLFAGVAQAAVLLRVRRSAGERSGVPAQRWWRVLPYHLMASGSDEELALLWRLLQGPSLDEQYQINDGEVHLTKHRAWIASSSPDTDSRPLIRGIDLQEYGLKPLPRAHLITQAGTDAPKCVDGARLLCQRIANQHMARRLKGALVEKVAAANSTLSLIPKTDLAAALLAETLVLLHSDLYSWLLFLLSSDNNIPAWKLKLFPWSPPWGLTVGQSTVENNQKVYQLFGITPAEQAMIAARLK